jgi:hypothetical protein
MNIVLDEHRYFISEDQERCKILSIKRFDKECPDDKFNTPFRVNVFEAKFFGYAYFIPVALLFIIIIPALYIGIYWERIRAMIGRYIQGRRQKSLHNYNF